MSKLADFYNMEWESALTNGEISSTKSSNAQSPFE